MRDLQTKRDQYSALFNFVRQFTGDPYVIDCVTRIVERMGIPERDEVKLARAVQLVAQKGIKYFREYPERWQSPTRTIKWRVGDCDDKSILIATMLRSFRIPVRLKFVRFVRQEIVKGKPVAIRVAHVYPQAYLKGEWVAIESVQPWPLGRDPEDVLKSRGYQVESETYGDTETKLT